MRKAKQSSAVVFPAGGAGGSTAVGVRAEHNRLQHSCHELSARAITSMQLFHLDQNSGASTGPSLVPHSISRMQMRHLGGLSDHITRELPQGLTATRPQHAAHPG